jgi:hypothetical protein
MSGAKHIALSSAQDFNSRNGKRLIAVSEEIEVIAARARSPADVYLEEEFKNLSKCADQPHAAKSRK